MQRSVWVYGTVMVVMLLLVAVGRLEDRQGVQGILASGTIEATEVEVAAKIPGRIEAILAQEGERVEAGALLVRLDAAELDLEVQAAAARVAVAERQLQDLLAGARVQEIKEAEAVLDQARADLKKAEKDLQRFSGLFDKGMTSARERDAARTAVEIAASRYQQAQERLELLRAGARQQQVEVARLQVQEAQAALKLTRVRRQDAAITSPISGTVLLRSMEPGEMALVGVPILTLGRLEDLWVKIYVPEADLGRISRGQSVWVTTAAFPNKIYIGTIVTIANKAEFTPRNVQTQAERARLVFAVKVALPNQKQGLKPGMMAEVRMAFK